MDSYPNATAPTLYNVSNPDIHIFPEGEVQKESDYCFANGSCADIWRAKATNESHMTVQVVVKVWRGVPYTESSRTKFWNHLMKELRTWKSLKHPNIVDFHGLVKEYGHLPGLVLPYFKNGTLTEYLAKNPGTKILPLVKDVARALSYLHDLNDPVVHGELKASNILVDDDGRALICDFGLATIVGEMNFTTANICGSCRWTAPEVMTPPEGEECPCIPVTTRSDVYSFAMTVIEMYTRRPPFSHRRNDASVIFDAIDGGRPRRPLEGQCPQLTDEIWELLQHCWHHDPKKRPNAANIVYWLEAIEKLNEDIDD